MKYESHRIACNCQNHGTKVRVFVLCRRRVKVKHGRDLSVIGRTEYQASAVFSIERLERMLGCYDLDLRHPTKPAAQKIESLAMATSSKAQRTIARSKGRIQKRDVAVLVRRSPAVLGDHDHNDRCLWQTRRVHAEGLGMHVV